LFVGINDKIDDAIIRKDFGLQKHMHQPQTVSTNGSSFDEIYIVFTTHDTEVRLLLPSTIHSLHPSFYHYLSIVCSCLLSTLPGVCGVPLDLGSNTWARVPHNKWREGLHQDHHRIPAW
jgi:hypothetical protein